MAATWIKPLHANKGKTIAQTITDRTDYAENPDKTRRGELVTGYNCDPHTVDKEFLLAKQDYTALTGRDQGKLAYTGDRQYALVHARVWAPPNKQILRMERQRNSKNRRALQQRPCLLQWNRAKIRQTSRILFRLHNQPQVADFIIY